MAASLETSSSAPESPEPTINPATNPEPTAQTGEASSSIKGKEQEHKNWERSITEMMSSIAETLKHLSQNQCANMQPANMQSANMQSANMQSANMQSVNRQSPNMQSTNTRNLPIDNIQSADIIRPTTVIEPSSRPSSRQSSFENSEPSTRPGTPLIPSYRSVSKPLIKLRPPKPFSGKEATLEKFLFQVEEFLDLYKGITEREKINVLLSVLEGPVLDWWRKHRSKIKT